MKAFYFNFSHDVQLASGRALYNLSGNVRMLETALQPLAVFVAEKGDKIVVAPEMVKICEKFYEEMGFNDVQFVASEDLSACSIEPWGWDWGLRKLMLTKAQNEREMLRCLPSEEKMEAIRKLSSRQSVAPCLAAVRRKLYGLPICGKSVFCHSYEELCDVLSRMARKAVLKAPWSSSGRGLRFVEGNLDEATKLWSLRLLQNQGGIEVEPFYDKLSDWAMEFVADESGKVSFTGLSHFFTSSQVSYSGGRVAAQKVLLGEWKNYGSEELLEAVKTALAEAISPLVKDIYEGPFGVDMMFVQDAQGEILLHPCVEINFRRTMGQMAQLVSKHFEDKLTGRFEIKYAPSSAQLFSFVESMGSQCKLLTPLTGQTCFIAYLKIDE